jgi:hypothetical protein
MKRKLFGIAGGGTEAAGSTALGGQRGAWRPLLSAVALMAVSAALTLAGCDNPTQVEGTVTANTNAPGVALGEIEATPSAAGVTLSWTQSVDVESYTVYRRAEGGNDIELGSPAQDAETGKLVYADIVSGANKLENGKSYTYTVLAAPRSSTVNVSRREVTVTTSNLAAKGTQVAKPASVNFEFDADGSQIKVTVAPPTEGLIPASYSVELYRGTSIEGGGTITAPATTGTIDWYPQTEGSYTVRVTGQAGGGYFTASDAVASAPQTWTALFASNASISGYSDVTIQGDEITGAYVMLSLNRIGTRDGVTYSFERAPVDANSVVGAWAAAALKTAATGGSAFVLSTGTDVLGNEVSQTAYDQNVASGVYQYRVKAEKAGQSPQYRTTSSMVTVDKINSISGSIRVDAPVTSGSNKTYAVTPSFSLIKGALAAGDKLVIYWTTGDYSSGYTAANSITFTKAELEAASVAAKDITAPASSYYVYAQAYIETAADGKRRNVGPYSFAWNEYSSTGISNVSSYYNAASQQQIYYAQLTY